MEDFAIEPEALSHFDPSFIEPTNEISPWHCQKACQERPPCQYFSFSIQGGACEIVSKSDTKA